MQKEDSVRWCIWAFIYLYLLVFVLVPFVAHNDLRTWDMAGHYTSAQYTTKIFPAFEGWNSQFDLGFPQNYFYGPLLFYIIAIFGQVMSVAAAFKLVVCALLIFTPMAFYYFARAFYPKYESSIITLMMFAVLHLFTAVHVGGNIHSLFNVGLVAHSVGIALFFWYVGALVRGKSPYFVSILLALAVLAHIVSAFITVIFTASYFFATFSIKNIKYYLIHGIVTFLLSALWVVPFFALLMFTEGSHIGSNTHSYFMLIVSILLVAAALGVNKKMIAPTMFLVFFYLTDIIGNFFSIPLHFYRFTMFSFLIFPLVVIWLIDEAEKGSFKTLYGRMQRFIAKRNS